jgi:hypothetical protein
VEGAATAKKGGGGSPLGSGWRNKKATWASTGLAIGPNVKCNWADTVKREKEELGCHKGLGWMQNRSTGKNRNLFWIFGGCLDELKWKFWIWMNVFELSQDRNLDIAQGFGSIKFELKVWNISKLIRKLKSRNIEIQQKEFEFRLGIRIPGKRILTPFQTSELDLA